MVEIFKYSIKKKNIPEIKGLLSKEIALFTENNIPNILDIGVEFHYSPEYKFLYRLQQSVEDNSKSPKGDNEKILSEFEYPVKVDKTLIKKWHDILLSFEDN